MDQFGLSQPLEESQLAKIPPAYRAIVNAVPRERKGTEKEKGSPKKTNSPQIPQDQEKSSLSSASSSSSPPLLPPPSKPNAKKGALLRPKASQAKVDANTEDKAKLSLQVNNSSSSPSSVNTLDLLLNMVASQSLPPQERSAFSCLSLEVRCL